MFKFNNSENLMTEEEILANELNDFITSQERKWMQTGERYYKVDNDINNRKMVRHTDKGDIEEAYKSNNKLAHATIKNLVDEKVSYLLSKEYTLECDKVDYLEKVKDTIGKNFSYTLTGLGYEASNKGIGYIQIYLDEEGKFNFMIIPAEQCMPIWSDNTHTELDKMIRFYNQTIYEGKEKKEVTRVEYWTSEDVKYYILQDENLIIDSEKELLNNGPILHYQKGGEWKSWGKVPFIAFKNNRIEFPDIRFIKSLLDNYDLSRSDVANFVEDVENLIYILKGYGGQDLGEFMNDLNYYRAIKIDDPQDGGVDSLSPTMDITAVKEHYEQLKKDIIECGQGVNKSLDRFGSAPSGIALRFLYSGLDLKCNALENEFKRSFEQLLYFINIYLLESSQGTYKDINVNIVFNRDIEINETETIDNVIKSIGVISRKTALVNHPWIKDAEAEIKQIEKEEKENEFKLDSIPLPGKKNNPNNPNDEKKLEDGKEE